MEPAGGAGRLGDTMDVAAGKANAARVALCMLATIKAVGDEATGDAIAALDDKSREAIERRAQELAPAYDILIDACPYPFGSPAAMAFAEAFERAREEQANA